MQIGGFKLPQISELGGAKASGQAAQTPAAGAENPFQQVQGNLLSPQVGGAHSPTGNRLNCCG